LIREVQVLSRAIIPGLFVTGDVFFNGGIPVTETIEFSNAKLAEAEAADRQASDEGAEPDPDELAAVLEGWE
jgi:hypothetical protein